MNLTSCSCCGVVLDLDNINTLPLYDADDCIIQENTVWNGDKFEVCLACPCCDSVVPVER